MKCPKSLSKLFPEPVFSILIYKQAFLIILGSGIINAWIDSLCFFVINRNIMPADVNSAFDIAFWFSDMAMNENIAMQPQRLQRMLFISQAYYSVAYPKRKLMPAIFVADELGPVEPNIFMAFSKGRPDVDVEIFLAHEVESFLRSVWERFSHYDMDRLNEVTNETLAFKQARNRGDRSEITLEAMRLSFARNETSHDVRSVMKPKIMRTQSGRPVVVKAWNPASKSSN